ncbi:D-stereospecific peptide hydrolase [Xylariaceae sp. FL0255]|nr:D-stereospecific peptide hydrolase [Xylariaceae sp. FL0255]
MPDKSIARREHLGAELEALLQSCVDSGAVGVTAAIASSGNIIWESAKGLSDIKGNESLRSDTHFGIGSITKVFVAVVILQLIDESKLSLGTTVRDILAPGVYSEIDNAESAAVEQLLSHHAGIDSWEDEPSWIVRGRGKDIRNHHIWGKTEPLEYIRRPRAIAPEPDMPYYANTNYTLLGLMIERVTGTTAEGEIRRRILEPLSMNQTYLEGFEEPEQVERLPHRYHWATDTFRETAGVAPSFSYVRDDIIDVTASNLSTSWIAGGMISSTHDILKFAQALRDGQILSLAAMKTLTSWKPFTDSSRQIGHGVFRFCSEATNNDAWLGHGGGVLGFSSLFLWKESGDCAISIESNVGSVHTGTAPSNGVDFVMRTAFLKIAAQLVDIEGTAV